MLSGCQSEAVKVGKTAVDKFCKMADAKEKFVTWGFKVNKNCTPKNSSTFFKNSVSAPH